MNKIIISDKIEKNKDGKQPMRVIEFNIPYEVFKYFLIKDDVTHSYAEFQINTNFLLWSKEFLTNIDVYRTSPNKTMITIYPYDNEEWLAKKTHRNYLKEKEKCVEFLIEFAKKISKLGVD
jgi:Tol biopolymer transport system component